MTENYFLDNYGCSCKTGFTKAFNGAMQYCKEDAAVCGDGVRVVAEACDDGNIEEFDGCDDGCQV